MYVYVLEPTTEYEHQVFLWVLVGSVHLVGDGGPGGLDQGLLRFYHLGVKAPVEPVFEDDGLSSELSHSVKAQHGVTLVGGIRFRVHLLGVEVGACDATI